MKSKIIIRHYDSPCGRLILGSYGDSLCLCDWDIPGRRAKIDRKLREFFNAEIVAGESNINDKAVVRLDEYFAGHRQQFDLPLTMPADGLRAEVWSELLKIPYGATLSYSDLATRIGRPQAVRAVASAIGANPMSVVIPCHRVVGKSGALTGYAGGLVAKRYLLDLEQKG